MYYVGLLGVLPRSTSIISDLSVASGGAFKPATLSNQQKTLEASTTVQTQTIKRSKCFQCSYFFRTEMLVENAPVTSHEIQKRTALRDRTSRKAC